MTEHEESTQEQPFRSAVDVAELLAAAHEQEPAASEQEPATTEQEPVLAEQEPGSAERRERLRAELAIDVIGNKDPLNPENTDYPNVLYHGTYSMFDLNTELSYRDTTAATGARTGRGLYCGALPVAEVAMPDFVGARIVEIRPREAEVIDLTDPRSQQPLSAEFRQTFVDFQTQRLEALDEPDRRAAYEYAKQFKAQDPNSVITRDEMGAYIKPVADALPFEERVPKFLELSAVFSRFNSRVVASDPETSLQTLFATADAVNGESKFRDQDPVFDITDSLDFLVGELGIDGAKTIQTFEPKPPSKEEIENDDFLDDLAVVDPEKYRNIDPELWHGYVFWKLDKVGDLNRWEEQAEADQIRAWIGAREIPAERGEVHHNPVPELQGSAFLQRQDVAPIMERLNENQPLVPGEKIEAVIKGLVADEVDPYEVVSELARGSEDMAQLLSGDVGLAGERFRLHEHTQAVLDQFEHVYGRDASLGQEDRKVLRTALLLQDIGKSLATADRGDKNAQTSYNTRVAANLLESVSESVLSEHQKKLVVGLIGHDILGGHLQGHLTAEQAQTEFDDLAASLAPTDRPTIAQYAEIMYNCDARAYAADARFVRSQDGSVANIKKPQLNYLFKKYQGHIGPMKSEPRERIRVVLNEEALSSL